MNLLDADVHLRSLAPDQAEDAPPPKKEEIESPIQAAGGVWSVAPGNAPVAPGGRSRPAQINFSGPGLVQRRKDQASFVFTFEGKPEQAFQRFPANPKDAPDRAISIIEPEMKGRRGYRSKSGFWHKLITFWSTMNT